MVADPINVFIKREAHKDKKADAGMWRLISGVSLTDCLVDRIIFGWILRLALSRKLQTPCALGWSPVRGGWRYLAQRFSGSVTSMDKSSWDWTVTSDMIDWALEFVLNLPVNSPEWWKVAVRTRFRLLFEIAEFKFQDGTVVRQEVKGIQKSGSLLTLILNSVWQSMLHYDACFELGWDPSRDEPFTMGDDTLQKWRRSHSELLEYASIIRSRGPRLDVPEIKHWIEFAGFIVVGKSCIPAYWKKHLINLLYADNPVETLQSYLILYSHYDEMYEWLETQLLKSYGVSPFPKLWCRQVMDSEGSVHYLA